MSLAKTIGTMLAWARTLPTPDDSQDFPVLFGADSMNPYTAQQYESLGRLVASQCGQAGHRTRILVQPELAGDALLVVVEHNEGEAPHRIVYGIEPDGYTHT